MVVFPVEGLRELETIPVCIEQESALNQDRLFVTDNRNNLYTNTHGHFEAFFSNSVYGFKLCVERK